jgi:hypothetical protein
MIVCVKCSRQMRPKKNGVDVVELARRAPDHYWAYKLWEADLWECQDCGGEALYIGDNRGQTPVSEHYKPDFERRCEGVEYRAKEWTR